MVFVWYDYCFASKDLTGMHGERNKNGTIGLYRENTIAIESEARDPFGGNVYYVTMQITFPHSGICA